MKSLAINANGDAITSFAKELNPTGVGEYIYIYIYSHIYIYVIPLYIYIYIYIYIYVIPFLISHKKSISTIKSHFLVYLETQVSKVGDHSRGWPEGSLFDSLLHQGVREGATPFPGLLHFTLDPYLIIKSHFLVYLETQVILPNLPPPHVKKNYQH